LFGPVVPKCGVFGAIETVPVAIELPMAERLAFEKAIR
jgi:hypothetical protein